ncbi:MAG: 2-oxoglutarate dehydrogenase E1 component [Azospirillum sp.]|nr:2-oxoglutarate dehydrogenase E1 component [Azospirillum sp.]
MVAQIDRSSFLYGANATFIAELYTRYLNNPGSVDASWSDFFAEISDDARVMLDELRGASWAPSDHSVIGNGAAAQAGSAAFLDQLSPAAANFLGSHQTAEQIRAATLDSLRAMMLIRVHRVRGHLIARLDPLGLEKREYHPELDPATYGFGPHDYDRPIFINYALGLESATLRQILEIIRRTYCGHIGVEYMHISDPEEKAWIQERIEGQRNHTDFTVNGKRAILERLSAAETFERFLQLKYTGTKRFGLEGGEAVIPAMEQILKRGSQLGLKEVVIGMAHRGRLNVLANFMGKPFSAIFSEFQGNTANPEDVQGSGDVKYHLGTSGDRDFDGAVVHLSLTANPSHLEAVDPVVIGKVRAKQQQRKDVDRNEVLGLLLHGDAAFAGQGLVGETLMMSDLKGYRTGGTIHIVVNNQIGFTTMPSYSRSGPYCTDVAKMVQAPIFHVYGDDPEAVVHVARIATEFRQRFKKDVVIDIFCYRRHGHNESDEPAFTNPLMYRQIKMHPGTRELYAQQLAAEKVVTEAESEEIVQSFFRKLEADFEASKSYRPNKADWLEGKWAGLETSRGEEDHHSHTSVDRETLREVGRALTKVPAQFDINSKIARQLKAKDQMFETGENIDWATGEALAFGTLLIEGTPVRLSGQDSGRGTFSQRHAVLVDQSNENRHLPLNHVRPQRQAIFEVHDSPLSEAAVLGFEYGYTLAEPYALVLWEAQFGDFANGAQVIFDQFLSSGESKWLRLSGLVVLLPHGYEGQGPEHSSARPERFLQLCAEDNMQVVNCTTPANYFHVLRRQMRRRFRKPLIVFTPKSLFRHKLCVSKLSDFTVGTNFQRVLREDTPTLLPADQVRRVVLCSGKVYYDLFEEREKRRAHDVALVRLEQLYPFPRTALGRELHKYPHADVVWCQEEPANMGSWTFVDRRIEEVLQSLDLPVKRPIYVGRPASASPATGLLRRHVKEQAKLVDEALTVAG